MRSSKTGMECRTVVDSYTRLKASAIWLLAVVKILGLLRLLEELCSDEESGVSSAASEGCRCKVSGINTMMPVPKIKVTSPIINGIHGDLAIRKDATVGAMSSAKMPALFPSRKTLALEGACQLYVEMSKSGSCLPV